MAIFPSAVAADSDLYIAVNNKVTNLTAGIDASVLTIPVASTTGFPSVGYISIDNEIIHYTSVGASQFNADLRGADGSTAASHLSGTQVNHNVLAAHHNVLKDEIKAIEQNLNDRLGLSATIITLQANMAANAKKITGLAAGTTNGDALRYEQLIGVYLPLAGGTLTGALLTSDGTNSLPAVAFASDPDTGIYRVGANVIDIAAGGTRILDISTAGAELRSGVLAMTDGTAALPSITFSSDLDTGLYSRGANDLGFTTAGAVAADIDSNGNFSLLKSTGHFYAGDGSQAAPAYSFQNDGDTGLWRNGANDLRLSIGNTQTMVWTSTQTNVYTTLEIESDKNVVPGGDNTGRLGQSGVRWREVWAANGTIQTSHSSTKQNIVDVDPETIPVPRGVEYDRDGHRYLGYLNDFVPASGRPVDQDGNVCAKDNYEQAILGILCAHVRKLEEKIRLLEEK